MGYIKRQKRSPYVEAGIRLIVRVTMSGGEEVSERCL
jgi:hypothetical protein